MNKIMVWFQRQAGLADGAVNFRGGGQRLLLCYAVRVGLLTCQLALHAHGPGGRWGGGQQRSLRSAIGVRLPMHWLALHTHGPGQRWEGGR
jgi:hypothetical protein